MSAGSAVVTGIVAVVIASMKFAAGPKIHLGPIAIRAYIVVLILIPAMVYIMRMIISTIEQRPASPDARTSLDRRRWIDRHSADLGVQGILPALGMLGRFRDAGTVREIDRWGGVVATAGTVRAGVRWRLESPYRSILHRS